MTSDKNFLYHLIISQLYFDGYGPYASLLEQTALNTSRAIAPSDRLKGMLSMCAHTVREVDSYFENTAEQPFDGSSLKENSFMQSDRVPRSTTPAHYHTLARRRLSAAKRHSFMTMNRSKQIRANQKSSFSTSVPVTSVPNLYSTTTSIEVPEIPVTSNNIQEQTVHSGSLFAKEGDKTQSAEAVRVLQNIFKHKRDMAHTSVSSPNIPEGSEMSHDLNSIINASATSIDEVPQNEMNNSPREVQDHIQKNPESPEKMDLTPSPIPGSSRSAFSPPNKLSAKNSTSETIVTPEPQPISSSSKGSSATDEDKVTSPVADTDTNKMYIFPSEPMIKEEAQEERENSPKRSTDQVPKLYPPASQDIIDQLNSLTASGIGSIQNLANSISSSFSESNLTEGNMGNLSSLSMESLASSLNLSMANVTGIEEQNNQTSRVSVGGGVGGVGGGGGSLGGSGKLDFLSRLEGDSPSMLSMMANQSSRAPPTSTTPPNPGRRFQCPHCNKCYASYDCLSRHKRIHTGANKKTCPTCFRLFFRADHFKTHTSNCTKKLMVAPTNSIENTKEREATAVVDENRALAASSLNGGAVRSSVREEEPMIDIQYFPSHYLWANQIVNRVGPLMGEHDMEMQRYNKVVGSLAERRRF